MKNTWKIAASAVLAAAALAATAMPTKHQLAEAQQLVKDLTAEDIRAFNAKQKTVGEVAAKHLDLAAKADTEAGKYLLLQGAFRLYARGGDYDVAADVLQRMKKEISNFPPEVIVELVNSEMRRGTESKAPRVLAIYKDARHTIKYRKRLAAAEADVEKRPTSKTLKQLAECHVQLGNWKKALEAFARARIPAAKWELDQKSVSDCDALKAAEYWWSYEADEPEPFRAHAAALYRIALDGGLVTGLRSEVVKKRIEEMEAAGGTGGSPVLGGAKLYCVIDLSAGPTASNYPVSYLAAEPKDGWTDEYKTKKLVLRRIEPGKFKMQGKYEATLTKPYYIGIFEITQMQYLLVTGKKCAKFKGGKRPVEMVSYNDIRGSSEGAKWPSSSAVDADSFMGRLRARTKLDFDLPTEAQWENACRAGTTSVYNNGGDSKDDLEKLGRYNDNHSDGKGGFSQHTVVGSYMPNAWGLYDMHGNVWEWCLDWDGSETFGMIDPKGASVGAKRVFRGGSVLDSALGCSSASRNMYHTPDFRKCFTGFRLALTLSGK